MKILNATKSVCDLLPLFTLAALFAAYGDAWLIIGVVLALAFLSSLMIQMSKELLPAKVICSFLPALGLLITRTRAELIITAIIISFYVVITIATRSDIHYQDYKTWFVIPAVPVAVAFIVCFSYWPIRPLATACAGAYLFLGVIVLRGKRMGDGAGSRHKLMNVAEVSVTLLSGVLASLSVLFILRYSVKVLEVILLPFAGVFYLLAFLCDKFLGGLVVQPKEDESILGINEVPDVPMWETENAQHTGPEISESTYDLITLLYRATLAIVVLILVVILLHLLWKMVRNMWLKSANAGPIEDGTSDAAASRGFKWKSRKKTVLLTNNEQMRQIYRDYLFFVGTYGIEIEKETTSEEVMNAAEAVVASMGAQRLRELYILARYRDDKQLSDSEGLEARTIFEDIKRKLEEDPGVTE